MATKSKDGTRKKKWCKQDIQTILICWWKIMELHFIKCRRLLNLAEKSSKTPKLFSTAKVSSQKNCKAIDVWCALCTIKILQQMSGHPYVHLCWSQLVIRLFSTGSHEIFYRLHAHFIFMLTSSASLRAYTHTRTLLSTCSIPQVCIHIQTHILGNKRWTIQE